MGDELNGHAREPPLITPVRTPCDQWYRKQRRHEASEDARRGLGGGWCRHQQVNDQTPEQVDARVGLGLGLR